MKFGMIDPEHVGKPIPHLRNKTRLELTGEITFPDFVEWLETHPVCNA